MGGGGGEEERGGGHSVFRCPPVLHNRAKKINGHAVAQHDPSHGHAAVKMETAPLSLAVRILGRDSSPRRTCSPPRREERPAIFSGSR